MRLPTDSTKMRAERFCSRYSPTEWSSPAPVFRRRRSRSPVSAKGSTAPARAIPFLAQCLSYFHRIEERGSGFRRMREQMLNHGLDQPLIGTDTGYFQVTFPGPGDNIERIRVPEAQLLVTPTVEAGLNERQKRILRQALEAGSVTRRWCVAEFGVANDTAGRDLKLLTDLGLLSPEGKGRAVRYVPGVAHESTDNRPT